MAEPGRQGGIHLLGPPDGELAGRRRAGERGRLVADKAEVDEIGWVVDFDRKILGRDRRLEGQREVQRERDLLGIEGQKIVDRLVELGLAAVGLGGLDLGERLLSW